MKRKSLLLLFIICGLLLFADEVDELSQAIKVGDLTQVRALVENGVDVNVFDSDEYTPLYYAIEYNQLEIVEYLITHGTDVNMNYTITMGPGQRVPPVELALRNDIQTMVDLLLKNGASQSVVRDYYNNDMYNLISKGNLIGAGLLILYDKASLSDDFLITNYRNVIFLFHTQYLLIKFSRLLILANRTFAF